MTVGMVLTTPILVLTNPRQSLLIKSKSQCLRQWPLSSVLDAVSLYSRQGNLILLAMRLLTVTNDVVLITRWALRLVLAYRWIIPFLPQFSQRDDITSICRLKKKIKTNKHLTEVRWQYESVAELRVGPWGVWFQARLPPIVLPWKVALPIATLPGPFRPGPDDSSKGEFSADHGMARWQPAQSHFPSDFSLVEKWPQLSMPKRDSKKALICHDISGFP